MSYKSESNLSEEEYLKLRLKQVGLSDQEIERMVQELLNKEDGKQTPDRGRVLRGKDDTL